ncbi:hypothetical protein OESDEN_09219 [Oesophagostomum dentatum]|uniref:Peptidase S1 domain-containing protein n=1 Tax=Oesophagostomum dentatum TaxID=61180 RepID=A0A0B1T545_OESDE|nr:hypothetical protein OESDEN_09219 [Oesophagostomum dentatum]
MPEENEQIGPSLIAMGYGWDPYAHNIFEPGLQIAEYRDFRQISNEIIGFESSSSSCEGDSGGPLFHQKNGRYRLLGITSRTNQECFVYNPFSRL